VRIECPGGTLLRIVNRQLAALSSGKAHDAAHEDRRISLNVETPIKSSGFLTVCGAPFRGLEAVATALDRLHRLASAIRRSSVESQKYKLLTNNSKTKPDSYFEKCVYQFLQGRFPCARASLLEQLTAAICFHRKRLLYQPRHNKKLANRRRNEPRRTHASISHTLPTFESNLSGLATVGRLNPTVAGSKTDASIPNSQLRRVLVQDAKPAISVTSTGSSIQGEVFHYPDPPDFGEEKFHPCPYCSEPLPTFKLDMDKENNIDFWRYLNSSVPIYTVC
jgi:hypothetical protein